MGVYDLWPLIRKKGYDPSEASLPHQRQQGIVRLDASSCFYTSIQRAYSAHPPDRAAAIFERALAGLVGHLKASVVCYLDGEPALEKSTAHQAREKKRKTALDSVEEAVGALRNQVERHRPATKQQHLAIRKNLGTSFRWSLEDRQHLQQYLQEQGWTVILSSFEADVEIARDCQEADAVLTTDCDFLAYAPVRTVSRLVTRTKLLVYNVPVLLKAIGYTRAQLTALCIVSKNDYDSNVLRLGTFTNFKLLKSITGADVQETVEQYRRHRDVVRRNNTDITFEFSQRVFVTMVQTAAAPNSTSSALDTRRQSLQSEYDQLCTQLNGISEEARALRQASRATDNGTPHRQKPGQKFNQFRTIDMPSRSVIQAGSATDSEMAPVDEKALNMAGSSDTEKAPVDETARDMAGSALQPAHPALARTRVPRFRPRYSLKERVRIKRHPPPPVMKQYKWKEHKPKPVDISSTSSDAPEKPAKRKKAAPDKTYDEIRVSIDSARKQNLVKMLSVEHPIVTLQVGTVQSNSHGVRLSVQNELGVQVDGLDEAGSEIANEVARILTRASRQAAAAKRSAQELVGGVIQRAVIDDGLVERAVAQDKMTLSNRDKALLDVLDLLCPPITKPAGKNIGGGQSTQNDTQDDDEPQVPDEEDGSDQSQFLSMLLQLQYTGVCHLKSNHHDALKALVMRASDEKLGSPWVESFTPARTEFPARPLVLSSAAEMSRELRRHFRKGTLEIQDKLQKMIDKGILPPTTDIRIRHELPAIINFVRLNSMLDNRYTTAPLSPILQPYVLFSEANLLLLFWSSEILKKELRAILNMTERNNTQAEASRLLAQQGPGYLLTRLVSSVGRVGFRPGEYSSHGYCLYGSIRTNGLCLQLLAYKMKELLAVKYKRLPESVLPERLTSTKHGTGDFLTEIRNVVRSQEDVNRLWGCDPSDISILALDLGQNCVVGAYALEPRDQSIAQQAPPRHYNLAVKTKAVCQPTFRYRSWLAQRKEAIPEGRAESVSATESGIPPRRGLQADFADHVLYKKSKDQDLDQFYNGDMSVLRHKWDQERAHVCEFHTITDRLLGMVGGSIGRARDPEKKVVIAVGLGDFKSKSGLGSLHESFASFSVQKCRSLGYVVVGVNEFYTSKRCPECKQFVGQVTLRRLFCRTCGTYMHRDVMASHNMAIIIQSHLVHLQRPDHLQPTDKNGSPVWTRTDSDPRTGNSGSGPSTVPGSSSSQKRKSL
ncbi:unnamed protein product [Mortierella alpina]